MKYLFVHQNFPGQFLHLARSVAAASQNQVAAIGSDTARPIENVELVLYRTPESTNTKTHSFARSFEFDCRRAEQIIYACLHLQNTHFDPDIIFVHCGWGEALPLRSVFPRAKIIIYAEMYYPRHGIDVDFDPEFASISLDRVVGLHMRNASTLLSLSQCDIAVSPTHWQKSTYPIEYHRKIMVLHDGIDTEMVRPDPSTIVTLPNGPSFKHGDPVITFVARNLEPLRGYHSFMRSLPRVLMEHPTAHVLIVGNDGVSYGQSPPPGETWKATYLDEVADRIDVSRVHFLGSLSYPAYLAVLQVSAVHVYLTYPFVVSWSLLEAMAAGCFVVASSTAPVREIIDGTNGLLVDFFDADQLAATILQALRHDRTKDHIRAQARRTIVERYNREQCVEAIIGLAERL